MASAKNLTQDEYKAARALLAGKISGTDDAFNYHREQPEPSDYLLAERLLDSGVIDIAALAGKETP